MPDLSATNSATLSSAQHPEPTMARPLTRAELLRAYTEGWGLAETVARYQTSREQVEAAEGQYGLVLSRVEKPLAICLDEAQLYILLEAGATLSDLALLHETSPSTILRRVRRWAAQQDPPKGWPPGGAPVPPEEVYAARCRVVEASARLGLASRGPAPTAGSWVDAVAEAGGDVEGEERGQNESSRVRQWVKGSTDLPWPIRASRWTERELTRRAAQLRARVGLSPSLSDQAVVLLEVYAEDDALEALAVTQGWTGRPYQLYRREAGGFVAAVVAGAEDEEAAMETLRQRLIGRTVGDRTSGGGAGGEG